MSLFKAAMLSAALVSVIAVTASAAELASTTPQTPPQVAVNPAPIYSYTRAPGPKAGPSNWIPSPNSSATMNSAADASGSPYSKKGTGPAPN
jgi:hypothetical protein